jgi:hypothetical protein
MGLSRLDNFLKSVRGTIIYVDPNSLDATDSVENQGNSQLRPFKTIQRALIESARFSYQRGLENDRFGRTTILLYPGEHLVDNRPGWIPDAGIYRLRDGSTTTTLAEFDSIANFDITDPDNILYKLNSVHGGVIIPRGTSIVGLDLRKTVVRPKYIPNPENPQIDRSAIFRLTGSCYIWQFTIFDGDPNGFVYKDYTTNVFTPNFSAHKLTVFEYADGVNNVNIKDDFMTYYGNRTDLDMYYEKIGVVYGPGSGRAIDPDYPSNGVDIQSKVDEYRIVGSKGDAVGIASVRSGDGITGTTIVTVTLQETLEGLGVDTPIRIDGVGAPGYDGQYLITGVNSSTEITYEVPVIPDTPLPSVTSATLNITVDSVTSASPYVFNVSLRSVWGMCGLHADGDKATGFKSMVVAQYTGISLQKDNNAFVKYDVSTGTYQDTTASGNENIFSDTRARYKPDYENYHMKGSNDAFLQLVSVFAIGFANHYLTESGADFSITNSNSNFGARSLCSRGFRRDAFRQDDVGYITHIIPPKENEYTDTTVEFAAIDVAKTIGVGSTGRLYLFGETDANFPPSNVIQGYRLGAKVADELNLAITQSGITSVYTARIVMPNGGIGTGQFSSEKSYFVGKSAVGINSVAANVLTLAANHTFIDGERVRIVSSNGQLPDGVINNQIYYAIATGNNIINAKQIKLGSTLNDALNDNEIDINNKGDLISVVSRVSDKNAGEIGHPVQFDTTNNQWYVNVSIAASDNAIYPRLVGLGTTALGSATTKTYITRKAYSRILSDSLYKFRYIVPKDSAIIGRAPLEGYIIQESNSTTGAVDAEVAYQFNPSTSTIANAAELRNFRFISDARWSSPTATFDTELPHNLKIGSKIEILGVKSTNNPTGIANSAYNAVLTVSGISSAKQFSVGIVTDPGTFINDTTIRDKTLPRFKKKETKETYQVYKVLEWQPYIPNQQDGIYHLTVLNVSNSPAISPFTGEKYAQPSRYLYPQRNRDNPTSDPNPSVSYALPDPLGKVIIDEPQSNLTRENIVKQISDMGVGIGLTNVICNPTGTAQTFFTSIDHGLNRITTLTIDNIGSGYGSGGAGNIYNARLVGFAGSVTGANATARITVDAIGKITAIKVMDGGSAYGIGNTLAVVGVATTTGFSQAVVRVTGIYNNIGDILCADGIYPSVYQQYNDYYRITGITVGNSKQIEVASANPIFPITPVSSTGLAGTTGALTNASIVLTGQSLGISTFRYDRTSGIATFTSTRSHGLHVNNKVRVGGAVSNFYNREFLVTTIVGLNTFAVRVGVGTTTHPTGPSTSVFAFHSGFRSAGGGIQIFNENNSGRLTPFYAGITTTLLNAIPDATVGICSITNVTSLGLDVGEYLLIDDEIVRIKTTVTGNPVSIFRAQMGTKGNPHVSGSIVKKIKVLPIELRRGSLSRAGNQTFEYVGFGPGNYSTSLPERQDRSLSADEEYLGQALKVNGGGIVYTGMNNNGDFYIGSKKITAKQSEEELFDAPVPTITGEDETISNKGVNLITPYDARVTNSLYVEGGTNGDIISQFDGPLVINKRLTSNSDEGIDAFLISLKGNSTVPRKITVGIATPTVAGGAGDIVYNATPTSGGIVGWVYTTSNRWEPFGRIANNGVLA